MSTTAKQEMMQWETERVQVTDRTLFHLNFIKLLIVLAGKQLAYSQIAYIIISGKFIYRGGLL